MAVRILPKLTQKDITRFKVKIKFNKPCKCWLWQAGMFDLNYGAFKIQGITYPAHRIAWLVFNGEFDNKLHVLHECDNPSCCNPNHLFLGTHQDNMKDKCNKGRQAKGDTHGMRLHPECFNPPYGERCANAKLTNENIFTIRELHEDGHSNREIACWFQIDPSQISRIVNRKRWKHI